MVSISRVFAGLEMLLSNSSDADSILDILANVSSLRSAFDNVRAVSDSCKYNFCFSLVHSVFEIDTSACLHRQPCRLLCWSAGQLAKDDDDRQAATFSQCSCVSRQTAASTTEN